MLNNCDYFLSSLITNAAVTVGVFHSNDFFFFFFTGIQSGDSEISRC